MELRCHVWLFTKEADIFRYGSVTLCLLPKWYHIGPVIGSSQTQDKDTQVNVEQHSPSPEVTLLRHELHKELLPGWSVHGLDAFKLLM